MTKLYNDAKTHHDNYALLNSQISTIQKELVAFVGESYFIDGIIYERRPIIFKSALKEILLTSSI